MPQARNETAPLAPNRWCVDLSCRKRHRIVVTRLPPEFHFCSRATGRIFPAMDAMNRDAVEELLQTYGETGGINYLAAAATLPSRLAIEAACTELMSLMFPGFRSQALLNSEDLTDITRTHIRNLHARLKTEICRSFGKTLPDDAAEAKAEEVLSVFLKELPSRLLPPSLQLRRQVEFRSEEHTSELQSL